MSERYAVARLDELDRSGADGRWISIRHHLGIEAFGVNARTADAGEEVVNEHAEHDGDEELYFVVRGRATFTIDGDTVDAPPGTLVFVRPGTVRRADAAEPDTIVLVVGAPPGEAYVPQEQEVWMPLYERGRYDEAVAVLESVLARHPDDPRLLYNLACMESMAGRGDEALEHLRRAVGLKPALAEHARRDDDFAQIRDDPRFSAVAGQPDAAGTGA